LATTTGKSAAAALTIAILAGWGQPPPAGSVLPPHDSGLIGYGMARNASIARQHALEDARANRFLSVRFETFQRGMGYAYSFQEFAIDDPLPDSASATVDSTRGSDGLVHHMVATSDTAFARLPAGFSWSGVQHAPVERAGWMVAKGSHRSIAGSEYRAYVLAKRRAIQAIVESRFLNVKVMDQQTTTRFDRFAYLSTKAVLNGIRVLEVDHGRDSTFVWLAIHPDGMSFYE
jgi:hypothetical protein